MARERKRHVQQSLFFGDKNGQRRGDPGRRTRTRGVKLGRPPKGPRSSERHKTRPELKPGNPVHVTLRVVNGVGRLRRRNLYRAVREATIRVCERVTCRIVHVSIQGNHIHLLVEADDKIALARGMQAFQISAAKHINAELSIGATKDASWYASRTGRAPAPKRRKGSVFADRYHAEVISTPRQARNALCYVLNNWRKHREDRTVVARTWQVDPFSSGWAFDGWKEREHEPFLWKTRDTYQPMLTWYPTCWLLREGWRRYGLIATDEVPGRLRVSQGASRD